MKFNRIYPAAVAVVSIVSLAIAEPSREERDWVIRNTGELMRFADAFSNEEGRALTLKPHLHFETNRGASAMPQSVISELGTLARGGVFFVSYDPSLNGVLFWQERVVDPNIGVESSGVVVMRDGNIFMNADRVRVAWGNDSVELLHVTGRVYSYRKVSASIAAGVGDTEPGN